MEQNDAIRNITGEFGNEGNSYHAPKSKYGHTFINSQLANGGGAFRFGTVIKNCAMSEVIKSGATASIYAMNFNAARVVPVAEENRPMNMAVKYLILASD